MNPTTPHQIRFQTYQANKITNNCKGNKKNKAKKSKSCNKEELVKITTITLELIVQIWIHI
jgi:ribosomal protein S25